MAISREQMPQPPAPDPRSLFGWGNELVRRLDRLIESLVFGPQTIQGLLTSLAGRQHKTTLVTDATYTIRLDDYIIDVNRAGTVTLTLPDNAKYGQEWKVRDASGGAASNAITIAKSTGENVNGGASVTLQTNYGGFDIYFNGTEFIASVDASAGGGDAWSDPVDADIIPDADGTRDLGATGTRFAETYTDTLTVTSDINVGGNVDGRDIASDGGKLDGIETGADVTDAANVAAAGALMTSGGTMSGATNHADQNIQRPKILDYSIESTTPSIATNVLTLDLENGNDFDVSWDADITTLTISNPPASGNFGKFTLRLEQDTPGAGNDLTLPAAVTMGDETEPDWALYDELELVFWTRDAGTTWYMAVAWAVLA